MLEREVITKASKEMRACLYAQEILAGYQKVFVDHIEEIRARLHDDKPGTPPDVIPLHSIVDHIIEQLPCELEKTHRILGTYNNE